jgi:hypothetical protein
LLPILASGKNVVSPVGSPMHWRHLADGEAFLGEITAACRHGRSTAFFTGIDPGSRTGVQIHLKRLNFERKLTTKHRNDNRADRRN